MIASKHIPPMLHVIYSGPALGFSSRRTLVTTSAASTGSFPIPGRWLGPSKEASTAPNTNTIDEPAEGAPRYGLELTADEWNPLGLPLQPSTVLAANMGGPGSSRPGAPGSNDSGGNFGDFLSGDLPKKLALLLGLLVFFPFRCICPFTWSRCRQVCRSDVRVWAFGLH